MVPVPVPDPELTVIQEGAVEVTQLQPAWVETVTLPDPPEVEKEALEGDMV